MEKTTPWSAAHGLLYGIAAGGVFALAELISAAVGDRLATVAPIRMAASVVLGQRALNEAPLGQVAAVGLAVHVALCAFWGLLYSFIDSRLTLDVRPSAAFQAASGMLFGMGVWLFDIQFIARGYFPWFLDPPQFLQAVLHAVFFGLPLGLLFAAAERRRVELDAARGLVE
jgi:hypothetical protein